MTLRTWPWDSVDGDRIHGSIDPAAALARVPISDGPVAGYLDELAVTENDPVGITLLVGLGAGWVKGRFVEVEEEEVVTLDTADPTNPRIDLIVMRANYTDRTIEFAAKTGTPAGSPVVPTVQQDDDIWEVALAQVAVAANDTTITNSNITDLRALNGVYMPDASTIQAVIAGAQALVLTATQGKFKGQYGPSQRKDHGTVGGGSETFNWNDSNVHKVTLNGNETFVLSNPIDGGRYVIIVKNSGAARTITWPASVKFPSSVTPTPSGSGKIDQYGLVWDATEGVYLASYGMTYL